MNGNIDKAKGRIKQAVGSLTGDDKLKTDGRRDEVAGDIKVKVDDTIELAKQKAGETIDLVRDEIDDAAETQAPDEQEK
jgi:uncharacterized protein YjbJ (UPF0337 family)